jgi:hypothetical protein
MAGVPVEPTLLSLSALSAQRGCTLSGNGSQCGFGIGLGGVRHASSLVTQALLTNWDGVAFRGWPVQSSNVPLSSRGSCLELKIADPCVHETWHALILKLRA